MKNIILLFVALPICLFSQKQANLSLYEGLGLQLPYSYYEKYNIDFSLYEEYKLQGVDLKQEKDTEILEQALFSNSVCVGKVIKKEYDTRSNAYFHTILTVLVTDGIKECATNTEVTIYQRSGSLGGDRYLQTSHLTTLEVGEELILFMDEAKPISEFEQSLLNANSKEAVIYNLRDSGDNYVAKFKHEIRNGFVITNDDTFPREEIISKLKAIVNTKSK